MAITRRTLFGTLAGLAVASRAKPTPPTAKLIIHIDGRDFYRETLPDIRHDAWLPNRVITNAGPRNLVVPHADGSATILAPGETKTFDGFTE